MGSTVGFASELFPKVPIRCPCGGSIAIALDALVTGAPIACDSCPATMRVDLAASEVALKALATAVEKLNRTRSAISSA